MNPLSKCKRFETGKYWPYILAFRTSFQEDKYCCSKSESEVFGKAFTLYISHNELTVIHIQFNGRDERCRQAETTVNLFVDLKLTYAIINQSDDSQGVPSAGIDLRPVSASL